MEETIRAALDDYVRGLYEPVDEIFAEITRRAEERGLPSISIRAEEGRMIHFLMRAVGARRVVEIGTLAGYSGTWIARALPPDGKLITLDIDPERAEIARESFRLAGLADRVEMRPGDALASLAALATESPFDALFIDANRVDYPRYLAWGIEHVRSGGLILAHNAFMRGAVVGAADRDPAEVEGVKALSATITHDPRLFGVIVPVGDGIAAAIRL